MPPMRAACDSRMMYKESDSGARYQDLKKSSRDSTEGVESLRGCVTLLCTNTSGSDEEHSFCGYQSICHSGGKRLLPWSPPK
jgi:hypothetical protein